MSRGGEQLAIVEAGPVCDPSFGQWLTDPRLARELVSLAGPLLDDATRRRWTPRVIEPSAGRGNLVRALLERCPGALVDAIEIDARWQADLLEAVGPRGYVAIDDYLRRPAPTRRYDLAICNVPFDDGEEGPHIAKLLDEAERINALLPTRSLHGRERYELIWHRFDPNRPERDWWIRQEVRCIARPKFGPGGGSDEIVLLDLRRTPGDCVTRWL